MSKRIIMKRIINIIIALIIPFSGLAEGILTVDRLIWNGDTSNVFVLSKPLADLLYLRNDIDSIRSKLFEEKEAGVNRFCMSGYIADWTIIENEIYLTNIFSINFSIDSTKSDLKTVFGNEYENGMVKATWISEQLVILRGKLIHCTDPAYQFYESELALTFKDGKLVEQKVYDNTKSYKSIFTENQDSLQNFIYSNIDWKKVPELKNEKVKVAINITSGETSKSAIADILRGADNEILNQEALRVVNLIPEWNVYYRRGEFYKIRWLVTVIFDEQKRLKYSR
jgi:hypothetical protein